MHFPFHQRYLKKTQLCKITFDATPWTQNRTVLLLPTLNNQNILESYQIFHYWQNCWNSQIMREFFIASQRYIVKLLFESLPDGFLSIDVQWRGGLKGNVLCILGTGVLPVHVDCDNFFMSKTFLSLEVYFSLPVTSDLFSWSGLLSDLLGSEMFTSF